MGIEIFESSEKEGDSLLGKRKLRGRPNISQENEIFEFGLGERIILF